MHHPLPTINPRPTRTSGGPAGGFTIIELLIVMAIIAVLGAIAFLGFRSIVGQGSSNRTRMALSNAASILAEYEVKTGLKRQPPHAWTSTAVGGVPATYFTPASGYNFWVDFDPTTTGADAQEGLPAPRRVEVDQPEREESAAVLNTQIVLYLAAQIPSNKTLLGNVPPDQTMRLHTDRTESGSFDETQHPVLLDAWDNPIIFVPASGLRGVYLGEPAQEFVITSVKVYTPTELPDGVVAPNARPFFASAGPDGVFSFMDLNTNGDFDATDGSAADDNLYSFER